jgi:hypothetical protein
MNMNAIALAVKSDEELWQLSCDGDREAFGRIVERYQSLVGTTEPATVPALFVYYVHCFRMEIFFLLAGFFARVVTEKRGAGALLKERVLRIG